MGFLHRHVGKAIPGGAVLALLLLIVVRADNSQITVVDAPDGVYTVLNLSRTGRLDHRLGELHADPYYAAQAKDILQTFVLSSRGCDGLMLDVPPVFLNVVMGGFPQDIHDPAMIIDSLIAAFLRETHEKYPGKFDVLGDMWQTTAVKTMVRIFLDTATTVGCGLTDGCPLNRWLCVFDTSPVIGRQPFSEEFFQSVVERAKESITVGSMTVEDMNTPLKGPSGSERKTSSATPLTVGLASFAAAIGYTAASFR